MRHHAKIDLESRLLAAKDDILTRAEEVKALHARRVAAARAHRRDPAGAGEALEAILKTRSYRQGGYETFDAFARAELGFTRHTAHRLRSRAAAASPSAGEADAAARALRRWLEALGVSPVAMKPHQRSARVTLVLDAADVARIAATRPRRERRR